MKNELAHSEGSELTHNGEYLLAQPIEYGDCYDAGAADAAKRLLDSIIPLGGQIANTIEQYGQAVVRFPEGIGWKDLMNRKTPGWEEWKQLRGLKDGKFQPMAAIKQRGISPTAAANLALQGAAMVVGQAYMAEISNQLQALEEGVAAIQREMKIEREAKVQGSFRTLMRYVERFDEYSESPEKRQAALNEIEHILGEANNAWVFEIKAMQELGKNISKAKRMDEAEVKKTMGRLRNAEAHAATAFQLMSAIEQVSMRYDDDFSPRRIERERERMQKTLEEYGNARGAAYGALDKQIMKMKGRRLAAPDVKEDDYESINAVADFAHGALRQAERFTPLALVQEGGKKHEERKNGYLDKAHSESPVKAIAESQSEDLDNLNYIYNEAEAIVISEDGIKFVSDIKDLPPAAD